MPFCISSGYYLVVDGLPADLFSMALPLQGEYIVVKDVEGASDLPFPWC